MAQTSITLDELYNIVKSLKVKATPTELWINTTGDVQLADNYHCELKYKYSDFDIIQIEFGDVDTDLNFATIFSKDIDKNHEYVQFTPDKNNINGDNFCYQYSWCQYQFIDNNTINMIRNMFNPIRRVVGYSFSVIGGGVHLLKRLLSPKESDLNVC